jgi:hypothetical protein
MLLWGIANVLLQPTFFAAAGVLPRTDLASGAAVLTMARQLGAALGVACLVGVLGGDAAGLAGNKSAWAMGIGTAVLTALAGLWLGTPRTADEDEQHHQLDGALLALPPEPAVHLS